MSDVFEQSLLGKSNEMCLLQDSETFRSVRDNKPESLCLTESLLRHTDSRGSISVLRLEDVVGAQVGTFQKRNRGYGNKGQQERHRLEVFAYEPGDKLGCIPKSGCGSRERRAAHRTWLASRGDTAATWAAAINDVLSRRYLDADRRSERAVGPGRRLLVLINPSSGTGRSQAAWKNTLRPMLQQAGVLTTPFVSTRGDELAEIIASAREDGEVDLENRGGMTASTTSAPIGAVVAGATRALRSLDDFDGIVVVGGDGTFFEVFQGLYARPDCARQLSRISLGIVPTGTGNGLAKTLSEESGEEYGVVGAAFLVAKGHTRPLDLAPTESGEKKYLGFLNVSWGIISDADIESEAYRWLGSLRFTVAGLVRIATLKYYTGRITFLPAENVKVGGEGKDGEGGGSGESMAPFQMPPLTEPLYSSNASTRGGSQGWTTVEGQFLLANISQTKYISHDLPVAPSSRLGDGLLDLFYIKKGATRVDMIKVFLAMEKGEHIGPRHRHVKWHRVQAFRIEPLSSIGRLTVDGELVKYAPFQQHIWRKAANIMCLTNPAPIT